MHCLVIMCQSYVLLIANQCCLHSRQGLLFLFYSFQFYQIPICLSFGTSLFHSLTKHRKAVSSLPNQESKCKHIKCNLYILITGTKQNIKVT